MSGSGGRVRRKGRLGFRNCKAKVEVGSHKALGRRAFEHACLQGFWESLSPAFSTLLQSSLPEDGQTSGRASRQHVDY